MRLCASLVAWGADAAEHVWSVVVWVADVVDLRRCAGASGWAVGCVPAAWIGELACGVAGEDCGAEGCPVGG